MPLLLWALAFTLVARLTPHPSNFTPAIALFVVFAGTQKSSFRAFGLPLLAILVSDLFIGFYPGAFWTYGAYLLGAIPIFLVEKTKDSSKLKRWGLWGLSSTVLFYFVSNFGVWVAGGLYPKTMDGLITCYLAALPFALRTLASTFFYGIVFYGLTEMIDKKVEGRLGFLKRV